MAAAHFPYPHANFGPQLQAYFNMLTTANNNQGHGQYTIVLWTGPSGMAQAEDIMYRPVRNGLPIMAYGRTVRPNGVYYTGSNTLFECSKCCKFQKTFKTLVNILLVSLWFLARKWCLNLIPFIPMITPPFTSPTRRQHLDHVARCT